MDDREAVEFLKELLSRYSPSRRERGLAAFLVGCLRDLGFEAEVDRVGNVVMYHGEVPKEGGIMRPDLLFLGHIDTVPGFIPVREEGGRIHGRGAVDAKGPLAAFVAALCQARGDLGEMGIAFVGAVGEEDDSRGTKHILPRFRPRAVIVGEPSGWDGIVLGYKGNLSVRYVVSRPLRHPAAPGPTAAEEALRLWRGLRLHVRRLNRGRRGLFETVDLGLRSVNTWSDGFVERAEIRLGFRLPLWLPPEELRRAVEGMARDGELSFAGGEPAYLAPKNTALVRSFLRAIRGCGGRPRFVVKTGTADMNLVGPEWGCPAVAYGPGDSRLDHTPDEHIGVEEFLRGVRVLAEVLRGLGKGSP